MKAYIIRALLFIPLFFSVERFCHKQTHGFRLYKIRSSNVFEQRWEGKPLSTGEKEAVKKILSQPFTFLNSGGQAYAFVSKDGNCILKLFKHHHMRRKEKQEAFFTSCKLADEKFRERTGLLYLHLNKTEHLKQKLTLFDPIGIRHKIDLDTHEFALQKRATLAYPTLSSLVEAGEIEAAKKRLDSLLDLIEERCKAGIADHDARARNFGFAGATAIELDLGSFTNNPTLQQPKHQKNTLLLETVKLRKFIKKHRPELAQYLDESMEKRLKTLE